MQAKPRSLQTELFKIPLDKIINTRHSLCVLGAKINWSEFDKAFGPLYSGGKGRPAKPTRLMVGLHYLKHTYNLSDEEVVSQWLENPHCTVFCTLNLLPYIHIITTASRNYIIKVFYE